MRLSISIDQATFNEAWLMVVDESLNLNRDYGHGSKQPGVEVQRPPRAVRWNGGLGDALSTKGGICVIGVKVNRCFR